MAKRMLFEKPWYLSVLLILYALLLLVALGVYGLAGRILQNAILGLPSWYTNVNIFLVLSQLVSLALLWMWKRNGFYVLAVAAILAEVIDIIYLSKWYGIIGVVIALAVLYAAMRTIWYRFA